MRAREPERRRLHDTFATLCRIESPTGSERAVRRLGDHVSSRRSACDVERGRCRAGGGIRQREPVRIHPGTWRSLADDVRRTWTPCRSTARVDPVLRDGGWENANAGILGADNKAAVAVLIELARRLCSAGRSPRRPDSSSSSPSVRRPDCTARPPSTLTHTAQRRRLRVRPRQPDRRDRDRVADLPAGGRRVPRPGRARGNPPGARARARSRPPRRRSRRCRSGRLDDGTTANIGTIAGGTARNVVPERCRIEGEVRALDEPRLESTLTADDRCPAGRRGLPAMRSRPRACRAIFTGYRTEAERARLSAAQRCAARVGYEPRLIASGGGSDANAFRRSGPARASTSRTGPNARTSRASASASTALEAGLALAIALLEQAASELGEGSAAMSDFELVESTRRSDSGRIISVGVERFRLDDGDVVTREKVVAPRRGRRSSRSTMTTSG